MEENKNDGEPKKEAEEDIYKKITNFVYETSIHSKTPRSGFWLLGSGSQSVAEHLFHTAMIAYALAYLEPRADKNKVVLMALFHDIGEGRTSDHNYVAQRYGKLAESQAVEDISKSIPFGREILELFNEEHERKTVEAMLVRDADILEWITTLRHEEIKGNIKAREWIVIALKRLKTEQGRKVGEFIVNTHPDTWWFDAGDKWFIDREEEYKKWGHNSREQAN